MIDSDCFSEGTIYTAGVRGAYIGGHGLCMS